MKSTVPKKETAERRSAVLERASERGIGGVKTSEGTDPPSEAPPHPRLGISEGRPSDSVLAVRLVLALLGVRGSRRRWCSLARHRGSRHRGWRGVTTFCRLFWGSVIGYGACPVEYLDDLRGCLEWWQNCRILVPKSGSPHARSSAGRKSRLAARVDDRIRTAKFYNFICLQGFSDSWNESCPKDF